MPRFVLLILLIAMCKAGVNFKHFHLHSHQEHHRPLMVYARLLRKPKRP